MCLASDAYVDYKTVDWVTIRQLIGLTYICVNKYSAMQVHFDLSTASSLRGKESSDFRVKVHLLCKSFMSAHAHAILTDFMKSVIIALSYFDSLCLM